MVEHAGKGQGRLGLTNVILGVLALKDVNRHHLVSLLTENAQLFFFSLFNVAIKRLFRPYPANTKSLLGTTSSIGQCPMVSQGLPMESNPIAPLTNHLAISPA
jgi:hypothetical protein